MTRILFACTLLASGTALADNNAVAVLNIQGTGVELSLLPTLTEVLTVEVDNLGMYKVVSGRDVEAMLGFEKQKDIIGCTDAACLAEIGGALGVDRIVASHIGKVGDTFVVNIKLINIRMADTEARVYETVEGKVDKLISTIRKSVIKLLGPGSKAATAMGVTGKPKTDTVTAKPAVEPDPDPAEVAVAEPTPGVQKSSGGGVGWLPITLWAGGGALLLGGLGTGAMAKKLEGDSKSTVSNEPLVYSVGAQAAGEKAKRMALVSNVLSALGVVAGGTGLLIWLLGGDDEPQTAVAPVLLPGGAGVAFTGCF